MQDYALYEKIIIKDTIYSVVICMLVVIASIIAIIYSHKHFKDEKIFNIIITTVAIGCIIGGSILGIRSAITSVHDISMRAYIRYDGVYIVDKNVETRSGSGKIYLQDQNKTLLTVDGYALSAGEHKGYVIYSEKTKIALEWGDDF